MFDAGLLWIIVGGLIEPLWVVALKRYDESRSLAWGASAVVFMIASPMFLSFGMETMPVGVAYAIWTGLGAVFTMFVGVMLYNDRIDRIRILFVTMIIVGVVGLQLSSEVVL